MPLKEFLEIPVRDDAQEFSTFQRGRRVLTALSDLGLTVEGKHVVDLGAGFGSLSIACAEAGAKEVLAADVHPDRLSAIEARAREAGVAIRTMRANLLQPWPASGTADLAFLIGVVEYAGLWDEHAEVATLQRAVFEAAHGALRPGGRLVFGSKSRLWPRFVARDVHTGQPLVNVLPRSSADRVSRRFSNAPYRHHIHSPKGWMELVRAAGFVDVKAFVPYLSYQFPLKIVNRPTFEDIRRVRRLPLTPEERRVAWGRLGTAKAALMATAGMFRMQMAHSTILVATKPEAPG
jgi:predicted RNA methylase